jgi:hypothetical protein
MNPQKKVIELNLRKEKVVFVEKPFETLEIYHL